MIHGEWLPPTAEALASDEAQAKAEYSPDFPSVLEAYARGERVAWSPPAIPDHPITWLEALAGEGEERRFSMNLANLGAVPNLPEWSVPDLECELDERGVTPLQSPPLPEHLAEVVRRHHATFRLAAQAAIARDGELLMRAIQLSPFGDYMQSAQAMLADARSQFGPELIF
jgi:alpha-galactosidase/6-phospho-beta-glucosidase family protein